MPNVFDQFDAHAAAQNVFDQFDTRAPSHDDDVGEKPSDWRGLPAAAADTGTEAAASTPHEYPTSPDAIALPEYTPGHGEAVGRILNAARQGYEETPPLIDPGSGAGQWLRKHGLEGLTDPLAPFAAMNAGFGGGEQAVLEAGDALGMPNLGRAIVTLPKAFPLGGAELGGFRPAVPEAAAVPKVAPPDIAAPAHEALTSIATGNPQGGAPALPTLERMAAETQKPQPTPPAEEPPAAPPPAPPEPEPAPVVPEPPAPEASEVPRPEATPQGAAPPAGFTMLDPDQLALDPDRFQYKAADARGVTGALLGTTRWEPALANPITAWEGDDGQLYVVNGHQRTDLAQRAKAAGQENVQVPARVFRSADGYTPEYMRALGAYQNIAEGTGTALDAAKVLRQDSLPDAAKLPQLPPRSALVQQAQGLAALDARGFGMVESGAVPPAYAAFVGAAIRDPAEQVAALDALSRAHPANAEQARIMVDDIRQSGFLNGSQTTLFGDEAMASALFPERARVLDNASRVLRRNRTVFKSAVEGEDTLNAAGNMLSREGNIAGKTDNERLLAQLDADATKRGPLSDALSEAAGELASGKPIAAVTSRFLTQARALGRKGEVGSVQPGDLAGGARPAGEAVGQPVTNLFGEAERPSPGVRQPEPTVASDPNQIAMPGMEGSAVQAQAARNQTGRGALLPTKPQQAADEGLFARPETPQPELPQAGDKLYSFPGPLLDPEAWRAMTRELAPVLRPIGRAAESAVSAVRDVAHSIETGLVPMRTGSVRAQAFAANFANSLRRVMYRFGEIDKEIERAFTPRQREEMGRAMDAQSVFEQQLRDRPPEEHEAARGAFDAERTGLAGLNPHQQHVLGLLDQLSRDAWRQMQERGLVQPDARPIPFYFPRQIIKWSEEEGFTRVGGSGGSGRGLDERGANLTTQGPMRREHLTPEETEAAARAKLGNDALLLRDIRSLPQRLAFAHRAIAGVDLMNQIENVGRDTGVNLVVRGDIPGLLHPGDFFTMADHPAFRRWTGTGWQAVHVSSEFEGPLRAVLTKKSPTWYRAAQMLKGGVMSSIMYSPFIHLAVEIGRALPVMLMNDPIGVLTMRALRSGSYLRRDLDYMDQATTDGLSPLGRSWHFDPVSIADQANLEGRNRFIKAIAGVRDAAANGAGKIGGETLRDIVQHPHQTLLWDQIFNLQVGLYDSMRSKWIAQGYSPDVAGTMAAHIANRYAGALPPEHLSRAANMASNLLLFSRSFTLGNLGVMKDMLNGAPAHVRSRIEQMAGTDVAKSAQSAMRRKAVAAVTMDIGLFYVANGLLQAGIQAMRQGAGPTEQDWLDKVHAAISGVGTGGPLSIFGVLPQHWNEPGKQDRVYAGNDASGRGVYLRLPPGKVGEEFLGWAAKPGTLLVNKASPLVRPIIEDIFGQDSLGRQLYPPNPKTFGDYAKVAGLAVKHIAESLGPTSTIEGLHEMWQQHVEGIPTQADPWVSAMKVLGPLTGLAQVSSGYPGGPAAGEIHAETERERFDIQHAMPGIRQKIKAGDITGAVADMTKLGVAPGLQRYYIRQTIHPGPTGHQMSQFNRNAPPEVRDRVSRMSAP